MKDNKFWFKIAIISFAIYCILVIFISVQMESDKKIAEMRIEKLIWQRDSLRFHSSQMDAVLKAKREVDFNKIHWGDK